MAPFPSNYPFICSHTKNTHVHTSSLEMHRTIISHSFLCKGHGISHPFPPPTISHLQHLRLTITSHLSLSTLAQNRLSLCLGARGGGGLNFCSARQPAPPRHPDSSPAQGRVSPMELVWPADRVLSLVLAAQMDTLRSLTFCRPRV